MTTITRNPGWDSKVRARVVRTHGSLRNFAGLHGIDVSDIPWHGRADAMKVWSRIVQHFGGTEGVERAL